jgi:pseudouridine synthase
MSEGRVRVNGIVVTELGTRVDPERDRVEVDGEPVRVASPRWIVLNKPAGVLTTRRDPGGRATVYDLLSPEDRDLAYVGRLDRDTEGLLMFTNDGDTANRLLHPSGQVEREYLADVRGRPDQRTLDRLSRGVDLEDGPARVRRAEITAHAPGQTRLRLVLVEGRKREVRRMLEAVGYPVIALRRVRFGPQRLQALQTGSWRELTRAEVDALKRETGSGGPGTNPKSKRQRRP